MKDLDVVLYAVPPQEFLDPVTALQASGKWDDVSEAIASNPIAAASKGPACAGAASTAATSSAWSTSEPANSTAVISSQLRAYPSGWWPVAAK